jgi:hypothetical protein
VKLKLLSFVTMGLFAMFAAQPANGSCVIEGACYALTAEVVSCEEM